ncbi:hypothetical protein N9980_01400, partial [bacterium]|nr:hypothetical protein [bacterium]
IAPRRLRHSIPIVGVHVSVCIMAIQLVTDSNSSQAFEITARGRFVWRFVNPEMNDKKMTRKNIYRMIRLTA